MLYFFCNGNLVSEYFLCGDWNSMTQQIFQYKNVDKAMPILFLYIFILLTLAKLYQMPNVQVVFHYSNYMNTCK